MIFRIALIILSVILAGRAESYPAVPSCTFLMSGTNYGTLAAAVAVSDANMGAGSGGTTNTGSWCSNSMAGSGTCTSVSAPACTPSVTAARQLYNIPGAGNGNYTGSLIQGVAGADTCPNGGTLSGATCTCGAGETDTGSACVPNSCPGAGTGMGITNFTVGWALSPTPNADDWVGGFMAPSTACQDSCGVLVDAANAGNQSGTTRCWRGSTPEASGLYRMSCDYHIVSSGTGSCTVDPNAKNSPSSPAPTCPGTSGTFNGQPICLGVNGNNVQPPRPTDQGNPRAGTSPVDETNAEREPTSGNGGGPDARGGPGVTQGGNGSVGTGNNRTPGTGGTGSNPTLELPTDYNREPTQAAVLAELKKARKIDETGTPDGKGVDADAKSGVETEYGKLTTGLDGIIAGTSAPDRSWGFSISFPSTCVPFNVGTSNWGFFTVDFCDFQDVAHDIMTLVWLGVTIFACVGMVFRAINAG